MPQLVKGGKWVFGWVVVQAGKKIAIPPEAYREYGFQAGGEIVFTRGSRRSGGFGVGRADKIPALLRKRVLAQGRIGRHGRVVLPPEEKRKWAIGCWLCGAVVMRWDFSHRGRFTKRRSGTRS